MEYFGNKYSDYKPVLPSKIIKTLNNVTTERQIPLKGLNISQMSFALRDYGFGTRIYSRDDYGQDFEWLISCYIESGLPVIIAMDNRPKGNIGHALLAIGHETIDNIKIDAITPLVVNDINLRGEITKKNITESQRANCIRCNRS